MFSARSVDGTVEGKKNNFLPLLGEQFIIIDFSFFSISVALRLLRMNDVKDPEYAARFFDPPPP